MKQTEEAERLNYKKYDREKGTNKMELGTGIKERRSVRRFEERKIDHAVLREIVETARYAPSWKNTQIVGYIVVEDREKIAALSSEACMAGFSYNCKTVAAAPAVVLAVYETGISGFEKDGTPSTKKGAGWEMFDAGIAVQTFCLAAYEKGLGTVILGYFDEDEIAKAIDIPDGKHIAAVIPMGYPDKMPPAPARKEADELLTFL